MKSILIAGGAGYIGSHVAKQLARDGYRPIVLDNLSTGNRWAVKWGPLIEGDIADNRLVRAILDKHAIEGVIHLAACAYVGESVENPRKYYRNNVTGSLAFLDALVDHGIDKIVFSSTCAVYGHASERPIDESDPHQPVNPYGESKLFIERALRWLGAAHQLKSVCLRYFNAAGADPEGDVGEAHDPETHIVPLIIQTALGLRDHVSVFGRDYPTADGSAVRDYTHVADLAMAHVLALNYLFQGGASLAVNLGTGRGHSVLEVIEMVERVSVRPVAAKYLPRRTGDPASLTACNRLAESVFGWQPKHRSLEAIVEHAWEWHSCHQARRQTHGMSALAR
jgi:UDP-arabinose 4-epimerase